MNDSHILEKLHKSEDKKLLKRFQKEKKNQRLRIISATHLSVTQYTRTQGNVAFNISEGP